MLQGFVYAANIIVVLSMVYLIGVMVSGRKRPLVTEGSTSHLTPVFIVPCLNEERVISQTLSRLLAVDRALVVVVDDGSDDNTSALIQSEVERNPDRLLLVQRTLPEARLGKGAALNYGFSRLAAWVASKGISPERTIVCVMDADGVIADGAVDTVLPYFLDPKVGGCQILVRIRNREPLVGRMQDVEFTTFTELVQTGRQNIGSSGLGGNGQFTRLQALHDLGKTPWSDCLVEDLDLGLQLLTKGWELRVSTDTHVAQQGLETVSRLVRQRTRWVQGLFQTWRRIPAVLAADLRLRTQFDIIYALVFPGVVTIIWPVVIVFSHAYMLYLLVSTNVGATVGNTRWWATILVWYLFTFIPSHYLLQHYRRRTREISVLKAFLIAHVYAVFQLIWYVAGWKALGRILTGRGGWVKTERYVEAQPAPIVIDLTSTVVTTPPVVSGSTSSATTSATTSTTTSTEAVFPQRGQQTE